MDLDIGRRFDLEELYEAYHNAKNSFWRDHYMKLIEKIMRESRDVRETRIDLIKAFRGNDHRAVMRASERIRYLRNNETYGHLDH